MKPSRLQTLLLMLPTWAFAHAVLIFRVLPLDPKGTALIPAPASETYGLLYFTLLVGVAVGLAILASTVAARRATILGWRLPRLIAVLIHVPFAGAGLALWLAASGEDEERTSVAPTAVAGRLVVPFLIAVVACIGLLVGYEQLEKLGKIPLGLKQTGGYFGFAIFAGIPFATGVSSGVILRRAGGTFGQAVAAAMTLIGAVILILGGLLTNKAGTDNPVTLQTANEVLGGSTTSRLTMDLRETKGWAYGAGTALPGVKETIPLLVYAVVGPSRILVLGPDSSLAPIIAATMPATARSSGKTTSFNRSASWWSLATAPTRSRRRWPGSSSTRPRSTRSPTRSSCAAACR